ncbi:MAG: N-acetyl-gamma-glutamyl-phosphate reductase [Chloroflexota bacterium]|jgi:N-acetyl-gamma-glutamyl-phosphate reductase|nr:N-acetyl-gamma-glutamyl-phosphate reductase [Chloroflexota bacterium]
MQSTEVSVAVIGATGYAGATAVHILERHPRVRLSRVTSRTYAGRLLRDVFPGTASDLELAEGADAGDADVVVVALPHGMAADLAPGWRAEGRTVIDLGADFRLRDGAAYERWYGRPHPAPALVEGAVFGLPELGAGDLAGAGLVACPGCYSTAAILALAPAARSGLARPDFIVDAASGISGAGRSLSLGLHYAEAAEAYSAYGVTGHRHQPEIEQACQDGDGVAPRVTFVPHLTPMVRGILATCYFDLRPTADFEALVERYRDAYAGSAFVRVVDAPPSTKAVAGTNECHVHVARQGDRVVVVAALDNLMKGAAGQAVQCLNLVRGWPENAGLELAPRWP